MVLGPVQKELQQAVESVLLEAFNKAQDDQTTPSKHGTDGPFETTDSVDRLTGESHLAQQGVVNQLAENNRECFFATNGLRSYL